MTAHRGLVATMAALRAGCTCDTCRYLRARIIGQDARARRALVEQAAEVAS